MPITYNPTLWSSGITPLNPTNMNKIEQGIVTAINGVNDIESGSIIAGKSTNDAEGDAIVSTYTRKVNLTIAGSSLNIELLAKDLTPTGTGSVDLSTVCMMLTGNQTISGTKSFSKLQTTHSPNANNDVVPLTYLNTNHYTKTEVNNLLSDKANESDCLTRYNSTNQEYVAQSKLNMNNNDINNVNYLSSSDDVHDWFWIENDYETLQDSLDAKQNFLVSGSNIKTINGDSVLGSGNLVSHLGTLIANNVYTDSQQYVDSIDDFVDGNLVAVYFQSSFGKIGFTIGVVSSDNDYIYIHYSKIMVDVSEGQEDSECIKINKSTLEIEFDVYSGYTSAWVIRFYQI